jgi:hypothetical protein
MNDEWDDGQYDERLWFSIKLLNDQNLLMMNEIFHEIRCKMNDEDFP